MTLVLSVCVAMLGAAAMLLVVRIARGPTNLDRALALDALVAVTMGGLIIEAAAHRHTSTLPVLVVLSLLAFVGSVSIARFTRGSDEPEEERS